MAHVFAMDSVVRAPMADALDGTLRAYASVLWHAIAVVLLALMLGLVRLVRRRDRALEALVSGIQLGFAALLLWFGLRELGTPWQMPQWLIFTAIPLLTRIGQRRLSRQP